jgi:signal peptidase
MSVITSTEVVERAPKPRSGGRLRAVRRTVVDILLWVLGGLGVVSVAAAIAAHVWGFSIVLFSTGSMSPTIPAGSAALVRLLPAGDFTVGDITTIERPGQLPITHRITSVGPLAGDPSARVVTMRGDANEADDPDPYVITEARLVVASVPGVAQFVNGLRDPRLMGTLTLLAGALATWAFWPRRRPVSQGAADATNGVPLPGERRGEPVSEVAQ